MQLEELVEDKTVSEPPAGDSMSGAIERARASIGQFFRAHRMPRSSQTDFCIQATFEDGVRRERLWLSHLDFNTKPATGIVSTRPGITTVSYRKRVPFRPEQMSDWMYVDNGQLVGGFTTKVLLRTETQRVSLLHRLKRRLVR